MRRLRSAFGVLLFLTRASFFKAPCGYDLLLRCYFFLPSSRNFALKTQLLQLAGRELSTVHFAAIGPVVLRVRSRIKESARPYFRGKEIKSPSVKEEAAEAGGPSLKDVLNCASAG